MLLNPGSYGSNQLYIIGDASYFAGSIFYLLGGLRDAGWWWWMPLGGKVGGCEERPQPQHPLVRRLAHG